MEFLVNSLRKLVLVTAGIAGAGLLTMVGVTCVDVVLRKLGHPLPGAYDLSSTLFAGEVGGRG